MKTENVNEEKSVLLVDDEIDICDFLAEYLEDKSIRSFYATDIETALQIAKDHKIHMVFLDNNLLSNVKGVEFIPQFKEINQGCKIYMLTANSKPEVKRRAEILGADGFIVKPFDFDSFDNAIEELY